MKIIFTIIISVFSFLYMTSQNWTENKKIVASDRGYYNSFGYSVSISGDFAIVGSSRNNTDANGNDTLDDAGAAYIFKKDVNGSWTQRQKIVAEDRDDGDAFGFSVSIDGNYATVGAQKEWHLPNGGGGMYAAGSVYIFKKDESDVWYQEQKIVASDRWSGDEFGFSVSLDSNYLVVGARQDNEDTNGVITMQNAGAAYIFRKNNDNVWVEIQKLVATDREEYDYFGWTVDIDNGIVIIGSFQEDEDEYGENSLEDAGSAYIFEKDESNVWYQKQKIVASDRGAGDFFGYDVAINDNCVIIGSRFEDQDSLGNDYIENTGSAYIFEKNEFDDWVQKQKIVASDRNKYDEFGSSVSIVGNTVLVGAIGDDWNAGSAYFFSKNVNGNWIEVQKIMASDNSFSDDFAVGLDLDTEYCIVGAHQEDHDEDGGNYLYNAGSAYIFKSLITSNAEIQEPVNGFAYPNPTNGKVNIQLEKVYSSINIAVSNIVGEVIHEENYLNTDFLSFNLINSQGLYIISITNSEYNLISKIKIMKK